MRGKMAPGGVEPPHAASKAAALSTELRGRAGDEGGGRDSNPRPPGPQPGALPTELPPPRQRHIVARCAAALPGYAGRRDGSGRLSEAAGGRRRPAARRSRLRRAARRLVRRARGDGRRDAVPRERDARPQRAARAARGGGASLRALRRRQPDQPAEPRADRGARGRAARARDRPADRFREPQLDSVPDGGVAGARSVGGAARAGVLHLGVQLVLGLPPVPRGHLPRAVGRRRRRARRC